MKAPTTGHAEHTSSRCTCLRLLTSVTAAAVLSACGGSSDSDSVAAGMKCTDLKAGQRFGEGVITSATTHAGSAPSAEYCEVLGKIEPLTTFAVRLPERWNERTLYVGGGGFNGTVASADPSLLGEGYAMIASSGGNDNPVSGVFALNEAALNDYAYLSVHRTSQAAHEIVQGFYGQQESKRYFEGCSNGGREGLIAAQRWPDDFDGIIARAPALDFQNIFLGFNKTFKNISLPGGNIPEAKIPALHAAVLAACDAQDGIEDGIIGQPAACQFNIDSMACTGAETDACLTEAQITTARGLYEPYAIEGKNTFLGFNFGSEGGWSGSQTGTITAMSPVFSNMFATGWVRYFVTRDAGFDPLQFDPGAYASRMEQLKTLLESTDPDLSAFRARKGKLLLWHGLADPAANPKSTVAYYQDVVAKAGGRAQADQFVKLYTAPGVSHCAGGAGADTAKLLPVLRNWVENDADPAATQIVATRLEAGAATLSRPLCAYPQYPKYKGSGDPALASSFACSDPI